MPRRKVKNKGHHSLKKPILILIGLVSVVAVAFYLIAPLVQREVLRDSLDSETKKALAIALPEMQDLKSGQIINDVKQLRLPADPLYYAIYSTCYTDHDDGGWFATNYNYRCSSNRIGFFEVPEDSLLRRLIDKYAEPLTTEYSASTTDGSHSKVYSLDPTLDEQGELFTDGSDFSSELYVVKSGANSNVKDILAVREIAFSFYQFSVVGYAADDAFNNRTLLEQHGSQILNGQKTYIILQDGEEYFRKDVGCRMLELFCESPV